MYEPGIDVCPLYGDTVDDCSDCIYCGDYEYKDGECVRRYEPEKMTSNRHR